MLSPQDTNIAFFGGAGNSSALDAIVSLYDAGYDVVVASHDPREAVVLREAGLPFVDDRAEALSGCKVAISSLATPEEVEDLYLGDNSLLELMGPGTYAIDVSFSTPELAREIYAMAAVSDIDMLDAPIVNLGEKEQAVAFVGGTPEAQEVLSPLFPYLASTVFPQKEPGEGQFAAMLAYVQLAGSLMGAVEAMSLAHVAEFPENSAINVLASTAGGSRALVDYIPRMLEHDYTGNLKVSELLNALEVVLKAADSLDVTVPMIETAYQLYDLLSIVGGDELNIQALALLYEDEKTCADFGLDWSLADAAQGDGGDGGDDDEGGGFDFDDFFNGPVGGGGPDSDGPQGGGKGPQGGNPGGRPPFSGVFSKN